MHGRFDIVQTIYEREQPDEVVCLGDYVDTHDEMSPDKQRDAVLGLLKLCQIHLSKQHGDLTLLMGNHDFHYIVNDPYERYSEYDRNTACWYRDLASELISLGIIKAVYLDAVNRIIYSHAGVTNTWLKENQIRLEDINTLLENESSLDRFKYVETDDPNGTGDSKYNSPIWVRPFSLLTDLYEDKSGYVWNQVVGHSPVEYIVGVVPGSDEAIPIPDAKVILCDAELREYLVETLDENGKLLCQEVKVVYDQK